MARDKNKPPYLKRIFAGKNVYIFAMVALAFAFLNIYRLNNPLEVGSTAPELVLTASNGESFTMNEILSPKIVIFYKKHTYFSNYIINTTYSEIARALKYYRIKGLLRL